MTIRNTNYGGSDWTDGEVLYSADLNDTVDATARGGYGLTAITSATAENNSIFLDSSDNELKKKDNSGSVALLGTVEQLGSDSLGSAGSTLSVSGLDTSGYNSVFVTLSGPGSDATARVELTFNGTSPSSTAYKFIGTAEDGSSLTRDTGTGVYYIKIMNNPANGPFGGTIDLVFSDGNDIIVKSDMYTEGQVEFYTSRGVFDGTSGLTQIDVTITGGNELFDAGTKMVVYGRK